MTTLERVRGSKDYLKADITDWEATTVEDTVLDGTVEISFDLETWDTAEWVGDVFMKQVEDDDGIIVGRPTRTVRRLVDTADMTGEAYMVYVRFTDNPETPILAAGALDLI